jgi:CRP-like cAMP-binding protein/membrane protease YdiL (CAAX protease family)
LFVPGDQLEKTHVTHTAGRAPGSNAAGTPREILLSSALFRGLTPSQVDSLAAIWEERAYARGEVLLREGEPDNFVYLLLDGRAELVKSTSLGSTPSRIGELRAGDTFGEVKIVDRQPSSASVVAASDVTVVAIDLDVFDRHALLAGARATVWHNVGQILAERLRRTSITGADAIHRELAETNASAYAGRFTLFLFCMIAGLQLAFSFLALVPASDRPPNTILAFVLVVWSAIPVLLSLRRTPFPLESYGLTFRRGWAHALQGLAWTVPMLGLLLLVKVALIRWAPSMAGRPVLDPTAVFAGRPFDWGFFALAMLLYAMHAPLQEFVVRAGLQGSVQHFLRVPPHRVDWKAIVISNLLFAAGHGLMGFWFSAASFVPGLFWGWMFAKQRSLIGVTISHIAVGWWALFALGLHAMIGGG